MAAAPPGLEQAETRPRCRQSPGPRLPPGYYGREDAPVALNLSPAIATLGPLPQLPRARRLLPYGGADVVRTGAMAAGS